MSSMDVSQKAVDTWKKKGKAAFSSRAWSSGAADHCFRRHLIDVLGSIQKKYLCIINTVQYYNVNIQYIVFLALVWWPSYECTLSQPMEYLQRENSVPRSLTRRCLISLIDGLCALWCAISHLEHRRETLFWATAASVVNWNIIIWWLNETQ